MYELPCHSRRPEINVLEHGSVVMLEFEGAATPRVRRSIGR